MAEIIDLGFLEGGERPYKAKRERLAQYLLNIFNI